jgi:uncharacterized membrane protein
MSLNPITFSPIFPLWLIILLLALGSAAAIFQYRLIRKRLGHNKALGLSLLRLAAISLLISFALNPSRAERREHEVSPAVAILVDTSQSMGLSGHAGKGTRLDEAKSLLNGGASSLVKSLGEKYELKIYGFGEVLTPIKSGDVAGLKGEGKKGDLTDALAKLAGKNSVAVLLSDGNLKWEGNNSASVPVIAVPLGDSGAYKDLLIKRVKIPALAFRDREVTIDVTVKGYGYRGLTLPVILKDGERLLTARNVRLGENPGEETVSLSFTPEEAGQHNLSVSIPPQFGESLASNNTVNLSLKVVRDKIRILMVTGSPSLNYRFLRTAFKNDPSIDLLSFVILRTPSNILNVPIQEQSLIPFPVETLFSKELKNFDLLIFDNFRPHPYLRPGDLEKVREFVKEGGALAMIGGPDFLGDGGYAGTPIEEILPVRWVGKEDYRRDSPLRVKLTRAGTTHPVMRLSPDERDNLSLWRNMPPLDGANLMEPKKAGTVLLESTGEISRPILTVGGYGKGRVLVLATDYSWKWYMGMVAAGKGNWPYLRLVERMARWLTKDSGLDPVQITLPERAGAVGQDAEFRIRVSEEGTVSLSVFNPDGMKIVSRLKLAGIPGEYLGSFLPEKGGTYRVKVETRTGHLEESMAIPGLLDDLDGAPDYERLKAIAASTGGKILGRDDDLVQEIQAYAAKARNRFVEERRLPLWAKVYILIPILGLLGLEWYLRRRWGLI